MRVVFPPNLRRLLELPKFCEAEGEFIYQIIEDLEKKYPGIRDCLLNENGQLRKHVNIFLDERQLTDRDKLRDSVDGIGEVTIMQALTGV
jgi:hypothetical protein